MIRISKMKFTRNMKDEFIVFYLQFINSLEGLGMIFSSAALIRRLRKYTATSRNVPSLFLFFTSRFLISTKPFQNGSVLFCSTACGSAAEMNEMSGYGSVPYLAVIAQHISTLNWNDFGLTSPDK